MVDGVSGQAGPLPMVTAAGADGELKRAARFDGLIVEDPAMQAE